MGANCLNTIIDLKTVRKWHTIKMRYGICIKLVIICQMFFHYILHVLVLATFGCLIYALISRVEFTPLIKDLIQSMVWNQINMG